MYNFIYPFSYFVCICLGIHGAPQPALPARGVWNYFMYSFICVWKIFLCIPLCIYKIAGTGGSRQKDTMSSSIYLYIMCTSILDVFICNYVYAWRSSFLLSRRRQQFQNMYIFMYIKIIKKYGTTCIH